MAIQQSGLGSLPQTQQAQQAQTTGPSIGAKGITDKTPHAVFHEPVTVIEISERLKGVPMNYLRTEMTRPSGNVPLYLVAAEVKRRQEAQQRAAQTQAQMGTKPPTVKDQLLQATTSPQTGMDGAVLAFEQQQAQKRAMGEQGGGIAPTITAKSGGMIKMAPGGLVSDAVIDRIYQQQINMAATKNYGFDTALEPEEIRKLYNRASMAADKAGMSPEIKARWLKAIERESAFHPRAIGKNREGDSTSLGIAQVEVPTGEQPGFGVPSEYLLTTEDDFYNPGKSLDFSAHYFMGLYNNRGQDVDRALASYNAGVRNIDKLINKHGDMWRDNLNPITTDYLKYTSNVDAPSADAERNAQLFRIPYKGVTPTKYTYNEFGNIVPVKPGESYIPGLQPTGKSQTYEGVISKDYANFGQVPEPKNRQQENIPTIEEIDAETGLGIFSGDIPTMLTYDHPSYETTGKVLRPKTKEEKDAERAHITRHSVVPKPHLGQGQVTEQAPEEVTGEGAGEEAGRISMAAPAPINQDSVQAQIDRAYEGERTGDNLSILDNKNIIGGVNVLGVDEIERRISEQTGKSPFEELRKEWNKQNVSSEKQDNLLKALPYLAGAKAILENPNSSVIGAIVAGGGAMVNSALAAREKIQERNQEALKTKLLFAQANSQFRQGEKDNALKTLQLAEDSKKTALGYDANILSSLATLRTNQIELMAKAQKEQRKTDFEIKKLIEKYILDNPNLITSRVNALMEKEKIEDTPESRARVEKRVKQEFREDIRNRLK